MVPSHPDRHLKQAATVTVIQHPDGNVYAFVRLSDLSSVETGSGMCKETGLFWCMHIMIMAVGVEFVGIWVKTRYMVSARW